MGLGVGGEVATDELAKEGDGIGRFAVEDFLLGEITVGAVS